MSASMMAFTCGRISSSSNFSGFHLVLIYHGALAEVGCDREGGVPRRAVLLPRIRFVLQEEFDHCERAPRRGRVEGRLALLSIGQWTV